MKKNTEHKMIKQIDVAFDFNSTYKSIEFVPYSEIVTHEFDNELSLNEYTNEMKSINSDYNPLGKFLWQIKYIPTELSTNYKELPHQYK
tara:strand:- start:3930 stop:4196 length:267 start_codon:yes stop_codon:yes gene_type:complete